MKELFLKKLRSVVCDVGVVGSICNTTIAMVCSNLLDSHNRWVAWVWLGLGLCALATCLRAATTNPPTECVRKDPQ